MKTFKWYLARPLWAHVLCVFFIVMACCFPVKAQFGGHDFFGPWRTGYYLVDPDADALVFWDDSASKFVLTTTTGLTSIAFVNGETIDNTNDDYIELQGGSGTDDTDIRFDLDGTYPVIESPTDTTIGIHENLSVTGTTNIIGATTLGTATSAAGNLSMYDAGTLTLYDDGDDFNVTLAVNDGEAVGTLTGGLDISGILEVDGVAHFDSDLMVGPTDPNAIATFRGDTEFTTAPRTWGLDELFLIDKTAGDGEDNFGASIAFSGPGRPDRQAAIVARQGQADEDFVGLDFYVHADTGANSAMRLALTMDSIAVNVINFGFTTPSPADKVDITGGGLQIQEQADDFVIVNTTQIGSIKIYGDDDTADADADAFFLDVTSTGTWTDGAEDSRAEMGVANNGTINNDQFVLNTDSTISGDPWNDQRSYIMAGQVLHICSDPLALWAWITPTTTEQDLTIENHDATYQNVDSGDQTFEGMVWSLELGGTDEYLTVADADDLSLATGGTDDDCTFFAWVEIYADANVKTIMAKYDDTNSQLEWELFIDAAEKVNLRFYDESAGNTAYEGRIGNDVIAAGWHFIVVTYASASTGESASDGMKIYVDGVVDAAHAASDGAGVYAVKENGTQAVWIGAQGEADAYGNGWVGELGMIGIDQSTMSAATIHEFYMATRGYYAQ